MSDNRRRILDLLAEGKINVEEAERLLSASGGETEEKTTSDIAQQPRKSQPKFLRVVVEPQEGSGGKQDRVNVRVPMALLRAGVRFASVIPSAASGHINEQLKEKGIDIDVRDIKLDDLEKLVDAMSELQVDVDNTEGKVRVYFE
ncbi:MAG TPA: DUF2089 domain-containing protein [Dehalococcoidia bacterium]|nr:DUF2089 domain-containing protein [Dehalococcoidia bacterium]